MQNEIVNKEVNKRYTFVNSRLLRHLNTAEAVCGFWVIDKPAIRSILMVLIFVIILCNTNLYIRPVFLSFGEMPLIDQKRVKHIFASEKATVLWIHYVTLKGTKCLTDALITMANAFKVEVMLVLSDDQLIEYQNNSN
ncbi:MAG: hypothetical protein M3Y53_01160 [Thermoproteota archaeon]|nr:hypothetical protein [Thermoproteota archaeon]